LAWVDETVYPHNEMVTNWAQCRVTSLVRPTMLPLCHAATQSVSWSV